MFIFCNFLETAENNFIKMNGFSVFSVKVDKSEWVLSKSKIAAKRLKKREEIEHGWYGCNRLARIRKEEFRREKKVARKVRKVRKV